jgi:plasmid replication initiation protein
MGINLMQANVVKSNALIEASYRLTAQEQRIVLSAISQIKSGEEITDQVMYSISVHDIAELTGLKPDSLYKELEDAALRLKRREIRIPEEPNGNGKKAKVLITSWLQSIQYIPSAATIQVRFSHDVLPYITQLKNQFTIYRLRDIAKLTSSYAIRLYEMLVQWKSTGARTVEIEWLKDAFLLNGKYPSIKDFKARVLEPAIDQINQTTNLWVSWDQKKTGRKVTHIIFSFGVKEETTLKKKQTKTKIVDIYDEKFLSTHARKGESRDQAIRRLKKEYNA